MGTYFIVYLYKTSSRGTREMSQHVRVPTIQAWRPEFILTASI